MSFEEEAIKISVAEDKKDPLKQYRLDNQFDDFKNRPKDRTTTIQESPKNKMLNESDEYSHDKINKELD